ncbi:hypothetical protein [Comamonas fluminis]|uniref:hypothetical protein n=1 Tax=Comamonas fluminis TaxID=2796366 RepID=UPI001C465F2D|nr:hypothetical protein [Comamonas fluminis]
MTLRSSELIGREADLPPAFAVALMAMFVSLILISGAANPPVFPISKWQLTANLQKFALSKIGTRLFPTLSGLTRTHFFSI